MHTCSEHPPKLAQHVYSERLTRYLREKSGKEKRLSGEWGRVWRQGGEERLRRGEGWPLGADWTEGERQGGARRRWIN